MKRYETFLNKHCGQPFADTEEDANGGLVMYDDAMEEVTRLNARTAELESALNNLLENIAFYHAHGVTDLKDAMADRRNAMQKGLDVLSLGKLPQIDFHDWRGLDWLGRPLPAGAKP